MLNKELAVSFLAILIVVIFLAVSYFLLIWPITKNQNNQNVVLNSGQSEQLLKIVKTLNSKVINTISASGKVSNIFARTITIENRGESIDIIVRENAQISSVTFVVSQGKTSLTQQTKADFSNIKIGDQVSVLIKVLQNGEFEAASVTIYSSTTK